MAKVRVRTPDPAKIFVGSLEPNGSQYQVVMLQLSGSTLVPVWGSVVGTAVPSGYLDNLLDVNATGPSSGEGIVWGGTEYELVQLQTAGLVYVFPAGSQVGAKISQPMPIAGDFANWRVRLDGSGSATFQVRHASGVTGTLSAVTGTQPSVTTALGAEAASVSWTPSGFSVGDIVEIELLSLTTATAATVTIGVKRT